jgi:uncharacterized membrane protein
MLEVLRINTVHPALVHVTIGGVVLATVAYVGAAWRRSERLSHAGDVTLVLTAVATLVAAAFGVVAYAVANWPGDLETWSSLHLAFGIATTVLTGAFAGVRLARRRLPTGAPAAVTAIILLLVTTFTGWIGGEVLAYHGGIAVRAAGEGALSPPLTSRPGPGGSLAETMDAVRAVWANAVTTHATMVVRRPSDASFAKLGESGRTLGTLASWVESQGALSLPGAQQPLPSHHGGGHPGAAEMQHGMMETRGDHLAEMARDFGEHAAALAAASDAHDLESAAGALGLITSDCSGCHEELRWSGAQGKGP